MKAKKTILLVVPRFNIGGAETYVLTLALGLKQNGYQVHVASGGGKLVNELARAEITHHLVPIRFNVSLAAYLLGKIVRRYKIDLIHANSAAAGVAAVRLKKNMRIPVIYTAHGAFGHDEKEMTLKYADKIICVSAFVRKFALDKGFPEKKLTVIYTGIDVDKFRPDSELRNVMRKKLRIEESAFTMVIVARLKNLLNKGHHDLLEILKTYEDTKDWHLLVVGKGNALWKLKYLIWKNQLGGRVHCIGHKIHVQPYLNMADVVVMPSKFETFGLSLAEGMAMAKPAVAYGVGGTPEVIADGTAGYLVKLNDRQDLHEKLAILAGSKELRQSLGSAARNRIEESFDSKVTIKKTVELYEEALGEMRSKER